MEAKVANRLLMMAHNEEKEYKREDFDSDEEYKSYLSYKRDVATVKKLRAEGYNVVLSIDSD